MEPNEIFDFFTPNVLNETINISLKHGYIYFEVPKAGTNSIKTALHALEVGRLPGPPIPPHASIFHAPLVKPYQISRDHLLSLLRDPAVFKFTFVREPYGRLLSAYLDKILGQEGPYIAYYRQPLGFDASEEVTFGRFAERVCGLMPSDMDKHWRPQFYQSFAAFCELDFVGRLESLEEDMMTVSERLGIDLSLPEKVAPHATGAANRLREFYTPEVSAMVADAYGIDFMQFGYPPAPSLPSNA